MAMTSTQRVRTALEHREPDRVPWFLPVTMHGAVETGVPLGEYYGCASLVAEGQLRLHAKYRDDLLYAFFHGALEHEAFGGSVDFPDDGPPTATEPLLSTEADIAAFSPPRIRDSPVLGRVLDAIGLMACAARGEVPVLAVVMGPASLPVMQLGFDRYFDLLWDRPDVIESLIARNTAFTVEWANAQLDAGADIIAFFDPATSRHVMAPQLAGGRGVPLMSRTMSAIRGPCAATFASARSSGDLGDLTETPAVIAAVGEDEDLATAKGAAAGRVTVMGNLSGLQMRRWTPDEARSRVRQTVAAAAPGGGFILSDALGEIPLQVSEDVLLALRDAVEESGRYPVRGNRS